MNRHSLRIAALALFVYLSVSPVASARVHEDRATETPGAAVVRLVKKIKSYFRGFTIQDEYPLPPIPKP